MTWIEPLWKMLLSNKALLAILWELYPGIQPAARLPRRTARPDAVRPQAAARPGGGSITVVTPEGTISTPGAYGAEGHVYQEFAALPDFGGHRPVLGAWVVHDEAAGLGIRETSNLITDDTSSFVPHRIAL